ncbi:MAG TPA: DUF2306 domain-containing protein [Actinophytocola sp.]|uniref:DUF2306 domain-containing protein n=1 Tax=Actinophytocola sp. TaxID=1872138 RepID=UPI002DB8FCDD|nr:DUF2306 domain-containing protein [Actinophytocola sp.]HEU5475566.1 DUF2306 domain-containing protein [Actinophytocola sp.]
MTQIGQTGELRRSAPARPWWRRPWMVPLGIIVIAFLAFSLPPYLSLQPAQSRVQLEANYPFHYLFVLGHVFFGTVAILTACLQVWPWLRRKYPVVHRYSGRVFVFGGMLPSVICAVALTPVSAGPFGNAVAAILWGATTFVGYRMARQRRWAEHRRFMIYSFAITLQVIWARVLFLGAPLVTTIDLNDLQLLLEAATWMGFVINLVLAQLWLDHTARRRRAARAARPAQRQQRPPAQPAAA